MDIENVLEGLEGYVVIEKHYTVQARKEGKNVYIKVGLKKLAKATPKRVQEVSDKLFRDAIAIVKSEKARVFEEMGE